MTSLHDLLDVRIEAPSGEWEGPVPQADIDTAPFWNGLREQRVLIMRCDECRYWVHPPLAGCPQCRSLSLTPEEVSGRGRLYSFTVANREFAPGIKPPFVAAFVDLVEQESLRMLTNIVNCRIGDLRMDMPVRIVFADIGEATLPLFEPDVEDPA